MRIARCVVVAMLTLGCASTVPIAMPSGTPASPIYREALRDTPHPRFYFSTRTADEANRFGWDQLGIAFYAYVTPVAGSVPVYCETPMSAPHSDYRFSTEPEAAAREDGWMRLFIAFHAFATPGPGLVAVRAETRVDDPNSSRDYATRDAVEARGFGWDSREIAFYAVDPRLLDRERAD